MLQVWLQEFGWTESKQCELLAVRNATSTSDETIAAEPMFCFETAMKAFYWSGLVYDTDQVPYGHLCKIMSSIANGVLISSELLPG